MSSKSLLGRAVVNEVSRLNKRSLIPLSIGLIIGFCITKACIIFSQKELQIPVYKNTTIADKLYHETRILCWVLTNPENHMTKAIFVKQTWGKRCNKLLFMSTEEDPVLNSIALDVKEGHDYLWSKTKAAFKYVYENHFDDADWFYKADDDTYAIMENMRYLLYPYSPDTPIYFGCRFKRAAKQGYMSGGAGYVLSKEALRRFVEKALKDLKVCNNSTTGGEDWRMGICLETVNVTAGDSRDLSNGRGRFFPFTPQQHLVPYRSNFWYWDYIFYKDDEGLDCCSEYAISFHYIEPYQMFAFDYLIYQLRPFGIVHLPETLPERLKIHQIMPPPNLEKKETNIKMLN